MKLKYLIPFCLFLAVIVGLTDTPVPLNVWRTNSVVASPTNFWRSNVIAGPYIQLTTTSSNITIAVSNNVFATNALLYAGPTNGSVSPLILTAGNGVTLTTDGTNRVAAIDTNVVAEISDLVWTNDGTAVTIAADTNRVRHFPVYSEFGTNDSHVVRITNGAITAHGYLASLAADNADSRPIGRRGGITGASFSFATNCTTFANDGAMAFGYFENALGCDLETADGGSGGAYFTLSTNCEVTSIGGISFGYLEEALSSSIVANRGSFSGGAFGLSTNVVLQGNRSCLAFGSLENGRDISAALDRAGFAILYTEIGASNVVASVNRGSFATVSLSGITNNVYADNNSFVFGKLASNERFHAPEGAFLVGRDLAGTNNWTFGIHGTNATPFSLAVVNNGVKFLVESNGTITSDSLTASTLLVASSGKKISSVANAAGVPTNSGSGITGYLDLANLAPASGGAYIATNNGIGWNTQFYSATNSAISTDKVSLTVKGIANQTGDLQQWLDSAGTTNALVRTNGQLLLPINSSAPSIAVLSSPANGISFASAGTFDFWQSGAIRTRFAAGGVSINNSFLGIGSSAVTPDVSFYRLGAGSGAIGTGVDSGFGRLTVSNLQVVGSVSITNALAVGGGLNFSRFATNANVSMTTNFYVWGWTANAVAGTLTLPSASTSQGIHFIIKDEGGNASATNITIAVQSGDRIDSATTATINANFGAKSVYSAGSTNWFIY